MTLRLSCLTLALFLSLGGVALAKPQIAVLGLEVSDKSGSPTPADAQVAEELTQQLRARAKTSGPYSLAPNAEKELIDEKVIKSCDDEKPTCMQGIGKDLGADFLLYGKIEKQNNAYQVTMFLFDVGRKTKEKTYPETIPLSDGSGPALAGWARKIYSKLTGQTDTCIIVVKTNGVDAGTILVNGSPKGSITNGVGQVNTLTEGRYKIAVEAKDYHRWEKDISCIAGQTTNVPAELEKHETTPPTPPGTTEPGTPDNNNHEIQGTVSESGHNGWTYVAIGTGVVGAAGITVGALLSHQLQRTNQGNDCTTMGGGTPTPTDHDATLNEACANGHEYRIGQFPAYIGGGVLLGVAAFAIYESLHHDDNNSNEHASAQGHRKHHEPFAIVPVASPNGGGVTFSMTW